MATRTSDRDGEAHRRAMRGLVRLLRRDLGRLRARLVVPRLEATLPPWMDAMEAVIRQYGEMSAALAAEVYDAQRAAAPVSGVFRAAPADPPPPEQVEATLRWATKDLWPRDPDAPSTVAQRQPVDVRLAVAERKTLAAAEKLVLGSGRETTRQAVRQDRDAVAYARAAALGACSFCKLMASRGAVYRSAETAGRDADELFAGDASVVKFHNSCHCTIVPVFRGQRFELSPHAAEWDRIYREYAQGHPGDQLRLFRRALAEHDRNPLPAGH